MSIGFEFVHGLTAGIEYVPDDVCADTGMVFCAFIHLGFVRLMIYKEA